MKYNIDFYDIESLKNIFTFATYNENTKASEVYYLMDESCGISSMHLSEANKQAMIQYAEHDNIRVFNDVTLYDLRERSSFLRLCVYLGVSTRPSRFVCDQHDPDDFTTPFITDLDEAFDNASHPYISGFNSNNYDLTIITHFIDQVLALNPRLVETYRTTGSLDELPCFFVPDPSDMRIFNDSLFNQFKQSMPKRLGYKVDAITRIADTTKQPNYQTRAYRIYRNFINSGRHFDTARLAERGHLALKRAAMLLGRRIKESSRLSGQDIEVHSAEDVYDLITYNIHDCYLCAEVFDDPNYFANFETKLQILHDFPDTIYDKKDDAYAPDIRPEKVSKFRVTPSTSIAQCIQKVLCPYGALDDIDGIDYTFPSKEEAKELNVEPFDVLEFVNDAMQEWFHDYPEVLKDWKGAYNYYSRIRGLNVNSSDRFRENHPNATSFIDIDSDTFRATKDEKTIFIFRNADGTPSTSYANLSIGGIHGQEYDKDRFDVDVAYAKSVKEVIDEIKCAYPDPLDFYAAKRFRLSSGIEVITKNLKRSTTSLTSLKTMPIDERWDAFLKPKQWSDAAKEPKLIQYVTKKFKRKGKDRTRSSWQLNPNYRYTSWGLCVHEDFKSFYPAMLELLDAFVNEFLGENRYHSFYLDKERYGALLKDETLEKIVKIMYMIKRALSKQIINSASGAAATDYDTSIRMNNRITSMRIIGQLFAFFIVQYQTIHGGKCLSLNTDGTYNKQDFNTAEKTLIESTKNIHIIIEPEEMFLVSKDTNNRIEQEAVHDDNMVSAGKLLSASGSDVSLAQRIGLSSAVDHSPLIDRLLANYLLCVNKAENPKRFLSQNADIELLKRLLIDIQKTCDPYEFLTYAQIPLASSPASGTYIVAYDIDDIMKQEPHILQHYNRVYPMRNGSSNLTLTSVVIKNDAPKTADNKCALTAAKHYVPEAKNAVYKKVKLINQEQRISLVYNDLHAFTMEEIKDLKQNIDFMYYVNIAADKFNTTWKNTPAIRKSRLVELKVGAI